MGKINCATCGTDNPENYKYCFNCGYELPQITTGNPVATVHQPTTGKSFMGKKILTVMVSAVAFALSYFAVQQIFFSAPSLDKAMMKVASEINETCPVMIDTETRLDNAISLPKNIFQYNYTLVNIEKGAVDTVEMRTTLEPSITNFVKTNPQMKIMRDNKITINYYYKDRKGKYMLLISITPNLYE
ncbi:MAG: zinc ribbon domain-containing protein [Prolixibacteraceae bacterium]|nr:zinc ribbon domain-containing protein [Prolixibacteraceae bacterium]